MSNKLKNGVFGIIFNSSRTHVLLVKRRDLPVWVLPGGGIDGGELPEAAAKRELEEESGYKVEITRKIAHYTPINRFTRDTDFFEAKILSGSAITTDETAAIAFHPLNNLPPMPPTFLCMIADAKKPIKNPMNKPIEGATLSALFLPAITHPIITLRFLIAHLRKKY